MEHIGVLGGSFSPVHHGHLWMAQYLKETLSLSKVVFVPTGRHAFKEVVLDGEHRLKMLELAIEEREGFEISTVELDSDQLSYTYQTMCQLKREFSYAKLSFILGSDIFSDVPMWHEGEALLRDFHLIVMARNDDDVAALVEQEPVFRRYREHIQAVNAPFAFDLSSSFLRRRIQEGGSISFLVPREVEKYIMKHRLFQVFKARA